MTPRRETTGTMNKLIVVGAVVLGLLLLALNVAAQQGVAPQAVVDAPTAANQSAILVTTVAGFLTLIATQFFAMWRESRNRKWDLEDRAAARRETRGHAEAQRIETVQAAIDLAKVSEINSKRLMLELGKNTAITVETKEAAAAAYLAANNFNEKIEAMRKELQGAGGTLGNIEEASTDTNEKVTELKDKLIP